MAKAPESALAKDLDTLAVDFNHQLHSALKSKLLSDPITEKVVDLAQLKKRVEQIQQTSPASALLFLYQHKNLLLSDVANNQFQGLVKSILELQAVGFAVELLDELEASGDIYAAAKIKLELARYYARVGAWPLMVELLQAKDIYELLPVEQSAEASLLFGTALQKLKQHRKAIVVYEKIKSSASVYRHAQLNLATAYLRQGWWTDAQMAVTNALALSAAGGATDLDYRMHTLLGFAQMEYGFYRDARTSFRQVAVDSQYVYKALFGLGLAALHQKDFSGALNAFGRLRNMDVQDMSIAESYLLYAFTLRQMQQLDAALAAYEQAIGYYQQMLALRTKASGGGSSFLRLENRQDKLLLGLQQKQSILVDMLKLGPANQAGLLAVQQRLSAIEVQYGLSLSAAETAALQSYLSQSQFGLASLYDHQ